MLVPLTNFERNFLSCFKKIIFFRFHIIMLKILASSFNIWRSTQLAIILGIFSSRYVVAQATPASPQVLELIPGWNLIPIPSEQSLLLISLRNALHLPGTSADKSENLIVVWGYQPSENGSAPGTSKTYQPKVASFPSDLTYLNSDLGYWIRVAKHSELRLADHSGNGALYLNAGWNLIEFSSGSLDQNESQDLASVFGPRLDRIPQVWTFDTSLQRFSGYGITAVPQLKELSVTKPGLGYWVYELEPITIIPKPYTALPGDADASPLEPEVAFSAVEFTELPNLSDYVGTQIHKVRTASEDVDLDLNANGIIDRPFTQNTLKFDVGVDRKVTTIGNNGTGLANWTLVNTVPWLFNAQADAKTYPGNAGRPKTASGAVASDRIKGSTGGRLLTEFDDLDLVNRPIAATNWVLCI